MSRIINLHATRQENINHLEASPIQRKYSHNIIQHINFCINAAYMERQVKGIFKICLYKKKYIKMPKHTYQLNQIPFYS